jgi:hypothetical protein
MLNLLGIDCPSACAAHGLHGQRCVAYTCMLRVNMLGGREACFVTREGLAAAAKRSNIGIHCSLPTLAFRTARPASVWHVRQLQDWAGKPSRRFIAG